MNAAMVTAFIASSVYGYIVIADLVINTMARVALY